jgi:hypothetical protein
LLWCCPPLLPRQGYIHLKYTLFFQVSKIHMIIYYFHVLCRENKRKRGKEVARTTEDSPTKNTTTKVMKKAKIKKRLVADL